MNSLGVFRNLLARLLFLSLFFIGWIALADANTSAQETYKTSEGLSLTFTLRPEKTVIFLNEPVVLTLELSTAGNEQFDFLTCLPGSLTGDQKVSITTEDGKPPTIIPRSGPCLNWAPGPIKESCHPRSSYGYDLSQMATFEEPGNYEITIEREVEVQNRRTGVRNKIRIKVSTPIQIVPRTPENIEIFIAENGQRLLEEDGDFYNAWRNLIQVEDLRAVPYFQQVLMAHFNDPEQDEFNSDPALQERLTRAREAATALGFFATDGAMETLLSALKSPCRNIRHYGLIGLLGCDNRRSLSPEIRDEMISLWKDPYWLIREWVISFLKSRPHPERERIYSQLAKDPEEVVRMAVEAAERELKSPPVP